MHIRKLPLYFVFGCAAHTYLIGDKYKCGILCRKAVEFGFGCGKGTVCIGIQVEKEVGAPQCYAVYQYGASGQRVAASALYLLLCLSIPVRTFLVVYHPFAEFFIPYTCRSEVDGVGREAERSFWGPVLLPERAPPVISMIRLIGLLEVFMKANVHDFCGSGKNRVF